MASQFLSTKTVIFSSLEHLEISLQTFSTHAQTRWLVLAVMGVVAVVFAPTLGGFFLSDDLSYIYSISNAFEKGDSVANVIRQFTHGLTSGGNYYYRPLTYASFTFDYALHNAAPLGYRLVNLFLHAANSGMVAFLFLAISRKTSVRPSIPAAAIAGLTFGLFPSSLEVVAWISGRFDALATFFLLLTLVFFLRSNRWKHWAPIALILGLLSKESAVLAVVYAGLIAIVDDTDISPTSTFLARCWRAAKRIAPLVLVAVAYSFLRWQIFGTPLTVYANSNVFPGLFTGAWLDALSSFPRWLWALTGGSPAVGLLMFCTLSAGALVLFTIWRGDRLWQLTALCAAALVTAYSLVFASAPDFAPDGRNGRLFYQILIPASWLLALPIAFLRQADVRHSISHRRDLLTADVYAVALLVCGVWLSFPAISAWRDVGEQSRALRNALGATAAGLGEGHFGVAFAPDWNRNIPFALNAVGGFVLPPFQHEPLFGRLILQTEREFESFTGLTESGLVTRLKHGGRAAILGLGEPVNSLPTIEWPDQYWCWRGDSQSLRPMLVPPFRTRDVYIAALRKAYSVCLAAAP